MCKFCETYGYLEEMAHWDPFEPFYCVAIASPSFVSLFQMWTWVFFLQFLPIPNVQFTLYMSSSVSQMKSYWWPPVLGQRECVAIKRPRKRESFTTGGKKNPEHLQRLHPGPSDIWIVYYSLYTFLENILHIGWFFNPKQQTNCMKTTNRCSG